MKRAVGWAASDLPPTRIHKASRLRKAFWDNDLSLTSGLVDAGDPDFGDILQEIQDAAEFLAEDHSARFVDYLREGQQTAVAQALARAVANDMTPDQTARYLRQIVALTPAQEAAVANYSAALERGRAAALDYALRPRSYDDIVSSALANDDVLSPDQISTMVGAYANNVTNARAQTIARTEMHSVLNEARQRVQQISFERAGVDTDGVDRTWHTMEDDRVRDTHAELEGVTITGMDEVFETSAGNFLRFPGDPDVEPAERVNCRCWLEYGDGSENISDTGD
jgi:hypothetical protein